MNDECLALFNGSLITSLVKRPRPELTIVMEQEALLMTRLESLKQEMRLALPPPTGRTFGPGDVAIEGDHGDRREPRVTRADV